jgi:hypothetical protein
VSVLETTDSWTYTTSTYRYANNSASNRIDVVAGMAESTLNVSVQALFQNTTAGADSTVAIGEDSSSARVANSLNYLTPVASNGYKATLLALGTFVPAVGLHFYAWIEWSNGAGTCVWFGDNGSGIAPQSGITGTWIC